MNPIPLLVLTLLAPLGSSAGSQALPYGAVPYHAPESDYRPHGYPGYADGYPDAGLGQSGQGPADWSLGVARDGRSWVSTPRGRGDGWNQGERRTDPYGGYGAPSGGLYEHFRSPSPIDGRTPGSREGASGSGWPAAGRGGERPYRFRTEGEGETDGAGGPIWHRGYRFRPLTGQEVERGGARPGWRPIEAPRDAPAPAFGVPETEGAYGYRPDDWFERYFGGAGW